MPGFLTGNVEMSLKPHQAAPSDASRTHEIPEPNKSSSAALLRRGKELLLIIISYLNQSKAEIDKNSD
jgi:hypothetical protein